MRTLVITFIAAAALLTLLGMTFPAALPLGSADEDEVQSSQEAHEVVLMDNFYSPPTVLVERGTSVRWLNKGFHQHTVTSQAGLWDSGPLDRGAEFRFTFTEAGTYPYFCRIHAQKMRGEVRVK
jgi:plastocyanin